MSRLIVVETHDLMNIYHYLFTTTWLIVRLFENLHSHFSFSLKRFEIVFPWTDKVEIDFPGLDWEKYEHRSHLSNFCVYVFLHSNSLKISWTFQIDSLFCFINS